MPHRVSVLGASRPAVGGSGAEKGSIVARASAEVAL